MDNSKQVTINGIPHKIGVHGLPMWKPNKEWVKCSRSVASIEMALEARDKRVEK